MKSSQLNHCFIAQKYDGHQFGCWDPERGDGRGLLLAKTIDEKKHRWDLYLKGAGVAPYSRFADGRSVLRSTIREYLTEEDFYSGHHCFTSIMLNCLCYVIIWLSKL